MEVGLSTLEVLEVQRASPRSAFQLRLGKDNSKFTVVLLCSESATDVGIIDKCAAEPHTGWCSGLWRKCLVSQKVDNLTVQFTGRFRFRSGGRRLREPSPGDCPL